MALAVAPTLVVATGSDSGKGKGDSGKGKKRKTNQDEEQEDGDHKTNKKPKFWWEDFFLSQLFQSLAEYRSACIMKGKDCQTDKPAMYDNVRLNMAKRFPTRPELFGRITIDRTLTTREQTVQELHDKICRSRIIDKVKALRGKYKKIVANEMTIAELVALNTNGGQRASKSGQGFGRLFFKYFLADMHLFRTQPMQNLHFLEQFVTYITL